MSPKIKERFISFMINLLTAGVMLTIFFLSRKDTVDASVHKEIDSKPSQEYVDSRDRELSKQIESGDNAVRAESKTWQGQHDTRHTEFMTDIQDIKKSQSDMYLLLIEMQQ